MYTDHFNALQSVINNQLINGAELPTEWYNQQYQRLENFQGHTFPRVYIEFLQPISWEVVSKNRKEANATIRLHLAVHDETDQYDYLLATAEQLIALLDGKPLKLNDAPISTSLTMQQTNALTPSDALKVMIIDFAARIATEKPVKYAAQTISGMEVDEGFLPE